MEKQRRYKHPKIALCRKCAGAGYITRLDEREQNEITRVCPQCLGSGRVIVSGVMEFEIRPFTEKQV